MDGLGNGSCIISKNFTDYSIINFNKLYPYLNVDTYKNIIKTLGELYTVSDFIACPDNFKCHNIYNSRYVNVDNNGYRAPIINKNSKQSIYLLGGSQIFGYGLDDDNTITKYLNELTERNYNIYNFGVCENTLINLYFQLKSLKHKKNDIIIMNLDVLLFDKFSTQYESYKKLFCDRYIIEYTILRIIEHCNDNCLDLHIFNYKHNENKYNIKIIKHKRGMERSTISHIHEKDLRFPQFYNKMVDVSDHNYIDPFHLTYIGSKNAAVNIYNEIDSKNYIKKEDISYLKDKFKTDEMLKKFEVLCKLHSNDIYQILKNNDEYNNYSIYLNELRIKNKDKNKIGLICMAGNPFTHGHRKLIEYASLNSDILYIFTPKTEMHYPTKIRLEMLENGTEHLNNVTILALTNVISSKITFSHYLFREDVVDINNVDFSNEIDLTFDLLKTALGVNIRFAGTEPEDPITDIYILNMKEAYEDSDCKFVQIPRFEIEDKPISASYSRKLIKDKQVLSLKNFLPETTINILNKYNYL